MKYQPIFLKNVFNTHRKFISRIIARSEETNCGEYRNALVYNTYLFIPVKNKSSLQDEICKHIPLAL
uniref:Uncharacterized protein n=1 Tax=viral metagenome TaxID=1070528 RepID=A0A6C0CKG5_9ZZZZ